MSVVVFVENLNRERVRALEGDPKVFFQICHKLDLAGPSVLSVVDRYADSLLNFKQLDRLLVELGTALNSGFFSETELPVAVELFEATKEARDISGYLFVEGD
jgi:hypothetical protein